MAVPRINLTRDQLLLFLQNQQQVKAFEQMFSAIDPLYSGVLGVENGGTGVTTLTGIVKASGTTPFTAGQVSLATEVTGMLTVPNGGTGAATLTGIVKGTGVGPLTAGVVDLVTEVTGVLGVSNGGTGGLLPEANGGTGETTYANGELLIGNAPGLAKSTLTAGPNISITNGPGNITINGPTGASGSFTTVDLKTVTVVNGIITSIV
jgi:hypothetical protein